MQTYNVEFTNGASAQIQAADVQIEWPSVKLLGENGEIVAAWFNGTVNSVYPAPAMTQEATPAEPEPEPDPE